MKLPSTLGCPGGIGFCAARVLAGTALVMAIPGAYQTVDVVRLKVVVCAAPFASVHVTVTVPGPA